MVIMGVTAKQMKEYAEGHGYTNWLEFRKDVGWIGAHEALKQIELEDNQLEMYVEPTVAEDATVEKRVIELPADSIAWLERMKSNLETIDVYDLLNNVLDDNSGSYHAYQFNFNSETDALNTLAEWVLGHVEFVPKKGHKFVVRSDKTDRDGTYVYSRFYNGITSTSIFLNLATKFDTYEEAKEWANSHQVVVEIDAEGNEVEE